MCTRKILIISDIHIGKEEDCNNVTNLTVATPELPSSRNPMESLKDFLIKSGSNVDAIVNLGDVTNQGYAAGWYTGIKMLRELSLMLNCPLVSTPGNHDYCLNADDKFDDKLLKGVKNYPTDDENANGKFWTDGFCIYECDNLQFLICNSERHLECKDDLDNSPVFCEEYISRIKTELLKHPFAGVKIAIVHHHVIMHSDLVNPQETDVIKNADKFLALLEDNDFYCVIHGHKHQPRITDVNGIHIVASGSLSSTQNTYQARIDNHFHMLVLEINNNINGYLESFKFVPGDGWKAISDKEYCIKPIYGFGCSKDLNVMAEKILSYYFNEGKGESYVNIQTIRQSFPEVNTLTSEQIIQFLDICSSKGFATYNSGLDALIMKK